jgi:hypothetical protein
MESRELKFIDLVSKMAKNEISKSEFIDKAYDLFSTEFIALILNYHVVHDINNDWESAINKVGLPTYRDLFVNYAESKLNNVEIPVSIKYRKLYEGIPDLEVYNSGISTIIKVFSAHISNKYTLIDTGLRISIPDGYIGQLSGIGINLMTKLINSGVTDLKLIGMIPKSIDPKSICKGKSIARLTLVKLSKLNVISDESL